ncbi:hypothetical protein LZP73_17065 [Shewanella sp. AS16]|uniref:hypothetical protein n=1 Tax=Shewanella sp. AS16 TaxID=2907625 RepID=UPI001F290817|nr:hypothetical protein [Shewanella sp. AS16]MCE9687893.1 hypothetical protein [Shewanella sp. AS16]
MKLFYSSLLALSACLALSHCGSAVEGAQIATDTQVTDAIVTDKAPIQIKPGSCGAMPPIRDTSKLKQNLIKKGVITKDMSEAEADAKVAEYIRQRQKAFESCKRK